MTHLSKTFELISLSSTTRHVLGFIVGVDAPVAVGVDDAFRLEGTNKDFSPALTLMKKRKVEPWP